MAILFPNEIILETENFIVAQDWEVPIVGFFIISTKRKVRSVSEFRTEEALEFGPLIVKIRKAMNEVLGIETVYVFQNEDTVHGFHLWLFPRHDWMEQFGLKIQSVRPIMKYSQNQTITEVVLKEVKGAVQRMKEQLQ